MAEPASGEESKSDSDATDGELHRTCRICYSAEFQDGMECIPETDAVQLRGQPSAVHETCLRRWQTIARRNRQWAAGAVCHACDSPYTVNLVEAGEKQPVAILGGTGLVGRALAAALTAHPIYCLGPVLGSPQTVGSKLADVWRKKEQALEDTTGVPSGRLNLAPLV